MAKPVSPKNKVRRGEKVAGEGGGLARRLLLGWKRAGMLRAGERLGVGVSGGADSVGLLLLLLELREKLGIVLSVAHLNHQLRRKASDADEKGISTPRGRQ